jgi:hypothetical protein
MQPVVDAETEIEQMTGRDAWWIGHIILGAVGRDHDTLGHPIRMLERVFDGQGALTLPGRFRIARSHDGSWARRTTSRGAKLHSRRSGQDDNGSNSSIRFPKGSST